MKALIEIDVPEWQIGQEVTVHFPDSMCKRGICKAAISYDRVTREVVGTKDDVKELYKVMLNDYMNTKSITEVTGTKSDVKELYNDICKECKNNPANGGSGICHCTLGTPKIT